MKKTSKLLQVVKQFLSSGIGKQKKNTHCFTRALKKLKKKEKHIKETLKKINDDKVSKKLELELCIIYEQRKKGVKQLKKIKKAIKEAESKS